MADSFQCTELDFKTYTDMSLQLLAHRVPNQVPDNSTGDVVASHYWLYKQDLARLKALGIPGTL